MFEHVRPDRDIEGPVIARDLPPIEQGELDGESYCPRRATSIAARATSNPENPARPG